MLQLTQADLQIHGHAVELRICAEDPLNNFLPDIGKLEVYKRPSGEGIRIDDGSDEGMDIPIYYDPMIAKLVVWGKNREEAMDRAIEAIDNYQISGVKTTLDFGKYVLKHPAFRSGNFDTNFVKHYFQDPSIMREAMQEEAVALAHSIDAIWSDLKNREISEYASREISSSWKNRME
jgi:acetyl/propionyl-CoA carboxylase alpha subunit